MKHISDVGACYVAFCMATCGYFCIAALNGWSSPIVFDTPGSSYSSGTSGPYLPGSNSGRGSGGFGGGGK